MLSALPGRLDPFAARSAEMENSAPVLDVRVWGVRRDPEGGGVKEKV